MKIKRQVFFTALFLLVVAKVSSQVNEPTPLSPQIAAFQQYGDINVNLSTGFPNIYIPLLNIDHFGYKLPISLNYFPTNLRLWARPPLH
jgi:hypothetical protein